jgi:hypothetical protein
MLGPVVDGDFVPALPSLLLSHGRFDDSIDVLVGHNGDEGFGYPGLANDTAFDGESSKTSDKHRHTQAYRITCSICQELVTQRSKFGT